MAFHLNRREFSALLGAAVVECSVDARAQTRAMPVIGILSSSARGDFSLRLPQIHQALKDGGYFEGRNVAIENRWANDSDDQLKPLAIELVQRRVAVIVTNGGNAPALAAKAVTSKIPIVFTVGDDPVRVGLVASLSHPGGNMTGVSLYTTELVEKRMELLRELVPNITKVALLVGKRSYTSQLTKENVEKAGRAAGLKVLVFEVTSKDDLEAAFASAVHEGAGGILVNAVPFFLIQRSQIVALAAEYALPAIYPWYQFNDAGGLISYGPNLEELYYQAGRYAALILSGASPRDLPVQLPTKFKLVINLRTAQALGLKISRLLNARADRVIE